MVTWYPRRSIVAGLTGAATALLSLAAPSVAAELPEGRGEAPRKWAQGLAGPQGLATDGRGSVFVVENEGGRVTRLSLDGRQSTVFVEGLRSPSWALFLGDTLYVAERKGNSIARITAQGVLARLNGEVVDPLGLAAHSGRPDALLAVSHRQSQVRRFVREGAGGQWVLRDDPEASPPSGVKYGWRDVAVNAAGVLYVTDELQGAILRRTPGGELQPWVTGLSSPSGLALDPRGGVYVTEEGNGRVSYVSPDGKPVVVAEGLGKAREVLLLDGASLLVTDRAGGVVWQVALPAASARIKQ